MVLFFGIGVWDGWMAYTQKTGMGGKAGLDMFIPLLYYYFVIRPALHNC
jgi:hypothetical protein